MTNHDQLMQTRDGWTFCISCCKRHNYCEICGSINYTPDAHPEDGTSPYQDHYDVFCQGLVRSYQVPD